MIDDSSFDYGDILAVTLVGGRVMRGEFYGVDGAEDTDDGEEHLCIHCDNGLFYGLSESEIASVAKVAT